MGLRDFEFKGVYRTEDHDLLNDFYIPALERSCSYDRAVGYFSAAMLSYAAQGLSVFVENDGYMRLIVGSELSEDESDAIEDGYKKRDIVERLGEKFLSIITNVDDDLFAHRMQSLSWLIAAGRLDIKVALRKQGMYHEKIGLFKDNNDDTIVFQGSANETAYALRPDFNFESISVYKSWVPAHDEFAEPYQIGFEKLWEDKSKDTYVVDFPEAVRQKLISTVTQNLSPPNVELERYLRDRPLDKKQTGGPSSLLTPRIPEFLGAEEYKLREHQRETIHKWMNNEYHGIFALATGAGKTITAIHASVRVLEAEAKRDRPVCIIVSAPYINLADQWRENLELFNISSIPCYRSREHWHNRLSNAIAAFNNGASKYLCIVVVNATLASEIFQEHLKSIPPTSLLWIGDECHHHGSQRLNQCLPGAAKYRIGLSATPEHYIDEEANERLKQYYGAVVANYSLTDAIEDGVLTPYKYYPNVVTLTDEEGDEYRTLSHQISNLMATKFSHGKLSEQSESSLNQLLMRRARLLGSADNKIISLRKILNERDIEPHTLFYCGDGSMKDDSDENKFVRQIETISRELHELGWRTSRFTSRETSKTKKDILENFRVGSIDAMVAIRCLDEGIDIPACRTAFLLASARNPRQFIQRRGRILRRAPGKEFAVVYDFLVQLPETEDEENFAAEKNLVTGELSRIAEFANSSLNSAECYCVLEPLLNRYDLEHMLI
jgi:superfamily II DNA or RNA helicase